MPWCDTAAMQAHLEEISAAVAPGAHAVVILDQAGWHMSNGLDVPANITLFDYRLQPYSIAQVGRGVTFNGKSDVAGGDPDGRHAYPQGKSLKRQTTTGAGANWVRPFGDLP